MLMLPCANTYADTLATPEAQHYSRKRTILQLALLIPPPTLKPPQSTTKVDAKVATATRADTMASANTPTTFKGPDLDATSGRRLCAELANQPAVQSGGSTGFNSPTVGVSSSAFEAPPVTTPTIRNSAAPSSRSNGTNTDTVTERVRNYAAPHSPSGANIDTDTERVRIPAAPSSLSNGTNTDTVTERVRNSATPCSPYNGSNAGAVTERVQISPARQSPSNGTNTDPVTDSVRYIHATVGDTHDNGAVGADWCPLLYFSNVTSCGVKHRSYLFLRTEPIVAIAETHLEGNDFHPLAGAHAHRWPRRALAHAVPSANGGTNGGVFMAASNKLKTEPTALHTFDCATSAHTSPHRDTVFYWTRFRSRRLLVGAAYAREGQALRVIHALAKETSHYISTSKGHVGCDFLIAADWNLPAECVQELFNDANVAATAVLPDGPTCNDSTIDYVIASPGLAHFLRIHRDTLVPWGPHCGLRIEIDGQVETSSVTTLRKPLHLRQAVAEHPAASPLHTWAQAKTQAHRHVQPVPVETFPGFSYISRFPDAHQATHELITRYHHFATTMEVYQLGKTTLRTQKEKQPFVGRALPPRFTRKRIGTHDPAEKAGLKGNTYGPHPTIALWATTANVIRNLTKHPLHRLIRTKIQAVSQQWTKAPPLQVSNDALNTTTDHGSVCEAIRRLPKGWQAPWKELLHTTVETLEHIHGKPPPAKRARAITAQAKTTLRIHERVAGLPAPTTDDATRLLHEVDRDSQGCRQ